MRSLGKLGSRLARSTGLWVRAVSTAFPASCVMICRYISRSVHMRILYDRVYISWRFSGRLIGVGYVEHGFEIGMTDHWVLGVPIPWKM